MNPTTTLLESASTTDDGKSKESKTSISNAELIENVVQGNLPTEVIS